MLKANVDRVYWQFYMGEERAGQCIVYYAGAV